MHKVLWVLAAGVAIAATGCSSGSRTVDAAEPAWVNEAGWVCDGKSCRVPKAIQSRQNG